jgi:hypothetical protein
MEQRVVKSEENHEQRVLILRDAMADFVRDFIVNKLPPLDAEIVALKMQNGELKKQVKKKRT